MKFSIPPIPTAPWSFWAYVAGLGVVGILSLIPSSVETIYTWWGALLWLVLLVVLFKGSNLARWLLLAIGVLGALGEPDQVPRRLF
jgi:hypothetical protein